MAKYIVNTLEKKTTSTGKIKLDAELRDEQGNIIRNVTIWGDFLNFNTITFGSEVDGDLKPNKDPKYGPTLYPITTYKTFAAKPKPNMTAVMEKKAENIAVAQGNKELGIKVSSTIRMAVDLAIAELGSGHTYTPSDIQQKVLYWRQWLWLSWDAKDSDFPPFNS